MPAEDGDPCRLWSARLPWCDTDCPERRRRYPSFSFSCGMKGPRSRIRICLPDWARCRASGPPPAPVPITIASYSIGMQLGCRATRHRPNARKPSECDSKLTTSMVIRIERRTREKRLNHLSLLNSWHMDRRRIQRHPLLK